MNLIFHKKSDDTCLVVIGFPPTTFNENDSESLRAGLLTKSSPFFK
jgi:hypothetical protein